MANSIKDLFSDKVSKEFNLSSRIHLSNSYFQHPNVYIKRDDELSSSIIGSKYRKYASLIPQLASSSKTVIITGSEHSNNVLGLSQLLIEKNIPFFVCVKKAHDSSGNGLWLKQICGERLWCLNSTEWDNVDEHIAHKMGQNPYTVLPEGASVSAAIPGCLTLAQDIFDWETKHDVYFDNIFIDSGTGLMAASLLNGLRYDDRKRNLFITHVAGNEDEFSVMNKKVRDWLQEKCSAKLSQNNIQVHHHHPPFAKSFGSVNAYAKKEWAEIMSQEGILPDLTYSVKHFYTVKQVLHHIKPTGTSLVMYSGGSFAARSHEHLLPL